MDATLSTVTTPPNPGQVSPLMLADRLITLAQEADRAGYPGAATHLMTAMYAVLDTPRTFRH